jgi:hypothetical protein
MRLMAIWCLSLLLVSCATRDNLIKEVNIDIQSLSLGMSKSEALPKIQMWQRQFVDLSGDLYKASEQFMRDGKRVQIFYVMTSRIPDGDITPDEFTPIVFEDDKLVSVGWTALGGAPEVFKADIKVR